METLQSSETDTIVSILPSNEAQARPLTTIDIEQVGEVWQEVVEKAPKDDDGKPIITGKHVKETVDVWKAADEPHVEATFDYDAERTWMYDTVQNRMERWPEEYQEALSKILLQLSKEAIQ